MSRQAQNVEFRSNASRTYAILRDRIIRCKVAPGQKLKIAELAESFEVSTGAVREALSRLSTEQLVVAQDQRGFRVAPISVEALNDLTEARVQLETMMLRNAINASDDVSRQRIAQKLEAMARWAGPANAPAAAMLHADFHDVLVSAFPNKTLLRLRAELYEQSQRYRYLAGHSAAPRRDVHAEHARIAQASISGDVDSAVCELTSHIRITSEVVRSYIAVCEDAVDTRSMDRIHI